MVASLPVCLYGAVMTQIIHEPLHEHGILNGMLSHGTCRSNSSISSSPDTITAWPTGNTDGTLPKRPGSVVPSATQSYRGTWTSQDDAYDSMT